MSRAEQEHAKWMQRYQSATHSYVGFKACGCMVAAVVDLGDKETARDVAEYIKRGYRVERLPIEETRGLLKRCRCAAASLGDTPDTNQGGKS